MNLGIESGLLKKDATFPAIDHEGVEVSGYASLFDIRDRSGDIVKKGGFSSAIERHKRLNTSIKMLWQHDPTQPIGVWDDVYEDMKGLVVKGRILENLQKGRETIELLNAGAIDGLSIGYRIIKSKSGAQGRDLFEIDLWEVSMVTFPMLDLARIERASLKKHKHISRAEQLAIRLRERNQKG